MRPVTIGVSALGTTSYASDRDQLLQAAVNGVGAADVTISTDQNLTAATGIVSATTKVYGFLSSAARVLAGPLKIPTPAGERIYLAFSAAGCVTLYFDDIIS
jgi:hypothetical protein